MAFPTLNLEALWSFRNGFIDQSGNNRDLTGNGGLGFTTDPAGGLALNFVNNASQFATQSDSFFNIASGDFSFSLWVNFNSVVGEQTIIEKFTGGAGPGWTFFKDVGNSFILFNSAGVVFNAGTAVADASYHLLTVVRNSGTISFYYDGSFVASGANASWTVSGNPLLIGERQGAQSFPLNAAVDDIAFWSRALSTGEISTIFSDGILSFPSGIVQYAGGPAWSEIVDKPVDPEPEFAYGDLLTFPAGQKTVDAWSEIFNKPTAFVPLEAWSEIIDEDVSNTDGVATTIEFDVSSDVVETVRALQNVAEFDVQLEFRRNWNVVAENTIEFDTTGEIGGAQIPVTAENTIEFDVETEFVPFEPIVEEAESGIAFGTDVFYALRKPEKTQIAPLAAAAVVVKIKNVSSKTVVINLIDSSFRLLPNRTTQVVYGDLDPEQIADLREDSKIIIDPVSGALS